jgi:hypothetical protein
MKIEPRSTFTGRKPDAFELKIRFACGALLGIVVGLGMCARLWPLSTFEACVLVVLAVAACGFCAARFGDRFWANLRWLQ